MVNAYSSSLHVGASWNRDLALKRASYLGAEFKRKGANVARGPVAGPIGRVARGGRIWEGFSADSRSEYRSTASRKRYRGRWPTVPMGCYCQSQLSRL
ncbi:hypothetical protein P168DRAFT_49759 [Aspergillus campestris IBT 28561]|uniref:beta-glucosidase n=1 Tax=Aspergillus campestris (strain IBT 28561) TaxID=1392248 RepID=A0A2I1CV30_ASPC2|nr:uncharacterized protein P168DRAFT_49759 [Aspergillus campestris IBT 28561]PKY01478.1 hypothetical protein P168DRAFT_49759 [Aspergillus campestris IBT 28561]